MQITPLLKPLIGGYYLILSRFVVCLNWPIGWPDDVFNVEVLIRMIAGNNVHLYRKSTCLELVRLLSYCFSALKLLCKLILQCREYWGELGKTCTAQCMLQTPCWPLDLRAGWKRDIDKVWRGKSKKRHEKWSRSGSKESQSFPWSELLTGSMHESCYRVNQSDQTPLQSPVSKSEPTFHISSCSMHAKSI